MLAIVIRGTEFPNLLAPSFEPQVITLFLINCFITLSQFGLLVVYITSGKEWGISVGENWGRTQ